MISSVGSPNELPSGAATKPVRSLLAEANADGPNREDENLEPKIKIRTGPDRIQKRIKQRS